MKANLFYIILLVLVIAAVAFPALLPNKYDVTLNYAYVTHDKLGKTSVNYTEYWTYQLNGSKKGVLTIIAYKTLRSYIVKVNSSTGEVIGAYYLQPPHYNITFGGAYYEPVVLLRTPTPGNTVKLLNSIDFKWKEEGAYFLLYNCSEEAQGNGTLIQKYFFLYSRASGYLINGTTIYTFESHYENYTLYNQNLLISEN